MHGILVVLVVTAIVFGTVFINSANALPVKSGKEISNRDRLLRRQLMSKKGKKGAQIRSPITPVDTMFGSTPSPAPQTTAAPQTTSAPQTTAAPPDTAAPVSPLAGNAVPDWFKPYSRAWDNTNGELHKCKKWQELEDGQTSFLQYDGERCKDRDGDEPYTCLIGTVSCPNGVRGALVEGLEEYPAVRCDCPRGTGRRELSCETYITEDDCDPCPSSKPDDGDPCVEEELPDGQLAFCPYGTLRCSDSVELDEYFCSCQRGNWTCDPGECIMEGSSEIEAAPGFGTGGSPTDSNEESPTGSEGIVMMDCPEDPSAFFDVDFLKCGVDLSCPYGEKTCCGTTYPIHTYGCEADTSNVWEEIYEECLFVDGCEEETAETTNSDLCPETTPVVGSVCDSSILQTETESLAGITTRFNVVCAYNPIDCSCDENIVPSDIPLFTDTCFCSNDSWVCRTRNCGECSEAGNGGLVDAGLCPDSEPELGDPCSPGIVCSYDECPSLGSFLTHCQCQDDGTFGGCIGLLVMCPEDFFTIEGTELGLLPVAINPVGCPEVLPSQGDDCSSMDTGEICGYGENCCCGECSIHTSFTCLDDGTFGPRINHGDGWSCQYPCLGGEDVDTCPEMMPEGSCDVTIHDEACGYGKRACNSGCDDDDDSYEWSCICDEDTQQWQCSGIMCPMILCEDGNSEEELLLTFGPAKTLGVPVDTLVIQPASGMTGNIASDNRLEENPVQGITRPETNGCPEEQPQDGTDCDTFDEPCTYGWSCCCGDCFENIYCSCETDAIDGTSSYMCRLMELECLGCNDVGDLAGDGPLIDDESNVDQAPPPTIEIDGVDTSCPVEMDMDKPCSAAHIGSEYCHYEPFDCCGSVEWGLSCLCREDDNWQCLSPGCNCDPPPIDARINYIDRGSGAMEEPHYSINRAGEPQTDGPLCPHHAFDGSSCVPEEWGTNVCNYGVKECPASCDDPTPIQEPKETCGCDQKSGTWFCWGEGCTGTIDCPPVAPPPICPDDVNDLWVAPIDGKCDPHIWSSTICEYGSFYCEDCAGNPVRHGHFEFCICDAKVSEWRCGVAYAARDCPPLDCGEDS